MSGLCSCLPTSLLFFFSPGPFNPHSERPGWCASGEKVFVPEFGSFVRGEEQRSAQGSSLLALLLLFGCFASCKPGMW